MKHSFEIWLNKKPWRKTLSDFSKTGEKRKNKTPFRRFFQYEYAELKNKPKN